MATRLHRLTLLWVVALTPLLVWTSSYEMFEQPKQLALKLAAALVAFALAAGRPTAHAGVPTAVALPLLAILGLSLLSAAVSPLPLTSLFGEYASYQGWLHWLTLSFLLLTLAPLVQTAWEGRRILAAATLSLTLVAGYALIQLLNLDWVAWSVEGPVVRTFSTAGNPLYLGFLFAAGFPASLGLAATATHGPARTGKLILCALLAAGLVSSGSRGALAGAAAGTVFFFWLMRGRMLPPHLLRNLILACAAALMLTLLFLPADRNPFPLLMERFGELARGEDSRPQIWLGATRLIRQAPLLGHGLDTFATLHPQVQSPKLWNYIWHGSPEKAHNELLQFAATAGLLGTGAVLWLLAVLARLSLRRAAGRPIPAAAASGLLALLLPGLFGFTTCGPQVLAVALTALLVAASSRHQWRVALRPWPPVVFKAAALLLVASLLSHLRFATAEVALKSAVRRGGAGLETALALPTPWAQRLLRAGDSLEHRWFGATVGGAAPASTAKQLALLARVYEAALAANPLHPFAHSNLARLALRAGRMEEALAGYTRARALAPWDAYLSLEHAQALIAAERTDEALAVLHGITKQYPAFAEPHGLIGYLMLQRSDLKAAEPAIKRSLELDWHGNAGAAYAAAGNLAALYHQAGREAEAAWAARQAQRFAPSQFGP